MEIDIATTTYENKSDRNLIELFINCQNPVLVNEAQQRLSEWEKEPLFYSGVLTIFQNQMIGKFLNFVGVFLNRNFHHILLIFWNFPNLCYLSSRFQCALDGSLVFQEWR